MRQVAWGAKVGIDFLGRVYAGCMEMGWPDEQGQSSSKLMGCIGFESGGSFDPSIRNKAGSSGTGLIQFMASTAENLGTTTDALAAMSAVRQLDYVFKYFGQFKKLKNMEPLLSDMYMAILMPSHIGESDDAVLFNTGLAYQENAGLDTNHDGAVTKGEAAARVQAMLDRGLLPGNVWTDPTATD